MKTLFRRRESFLRGMSLLSAIPLLAAGLFGSVEIAKRGQAGIRIVVAENASETERFAAQELALFLHIVTGGHFAVNPGVEEIPAPRLLVGEGAAKLADPAFSASTLAPEEILVRNAGSDVILAGGSPRGTLYAVYAFLEDAVGCRWWTGTASHMPWKPTLRIARLDVRYKPPFEYREPFWYVAFDPVWAARNKANGILAGGDEERGGHQVYEGFVHTFYRLIPPETYFAGHPEWFSEIDGKRTSTNAQLCLTNEEMRQELVRNLRERLKANPKATIASVSQNDCFGFCTCPKCKAVDEEEGGPAGSLLRFVNAVAADLEAEFPDVAFDTLAYQYTRKPPRLVKPRPNVIVRLCSIECSFARPLDDPRNKDFFTDLEGWSKIAGRLYVWDYTTDFAHYVQPHPNVPVLAPNIRLFARHNVRGVFEQGAYQSWGSEMAELCAWMLAKLLWNPGLDPEKLRREFLRGYFGPAAGAVAGYLGLIESAVARSGDKLGCYSPPDAGFLSLKTLDAAWSILKRAERKAGGNDVYLRRVRLAQLPAAYVVLTRWDALREEARKRGSAWPWPTQRESLLEWFLGIARAEKIAMISEGETFEDWAARAGQKR